MHSQTRLSLGAVTASLFLLIGTWATAPTFAHGSVPGAAPLATGFSFGAAGDYGFSGDAQSVMSTMGSYGLDFVLGLGDLPYTEATEAAWCNFFESQVGDGRVILIAGNHDTGESSGGDINILRQHCNFGIDAPLTGDYGKEFYFDYPRVSPLMRIIGTGCGLNWVLDGTGYWSCPVGDVHYDFIRDAIDGARAAGIPWVAVYSHKPCLSSHSYGCELGQAVLDLVTSKGVDLLLSAHSHNYQRSKQLACATDNNYRPECVSHAHSPYTKGDGTVMHIVGTGGRGLYPLEDNADTPYFAVTNSDSKGFQKYTVTATSIRMDYVRISGSLAESYEIVSDQTEGGAVDFPGAYQLIPLYFPGIGFGLLLIAFLADRRRRRRRDDASLAALREQGRRGGVP